MALLSPRLALATLSALHCSVINYLSHFSKLSPPSGPSPMSQTYKTQIYTRENISCPGVLVLDQNGKVVNGQLRH